MISNANFVAFENGESLRRCPLGEPGSLQTAPAGARKLRKSKPELRDRAIQLYHTKCPFGVKLPYAAKTASCPLLHC
jgi:hypothetical protein